MLKVEVARQQNIHEFKYVFGKNKYWLRHVLGYSHVLALSSKSRHNYVADKNKNKVLYSLSCNHDCFESSKSIKSNT